MSDELSKQIVLIEKLLKKEENKFCADCRRKSPSWASITAGVFVCIKCSGFHRELGVHITKIKSINLDKWPKGVANLFTKINNKMANEYWESKLKDMDFEKLQNDEYSLFDFIKDKYERKRYARKGKDPMTLIYEGKDPEEGESKKEKAKDSDSSENEDVTNKKQLKSIKLKKETKEETKSNNKVDLIQSQKGNNASLIDFNGGSVTESTVNNGNTGGNLLSLWTENTNETKTGNKQSSFSFINKNQNTQVNTLNVTNTNTSTNGSNSLIDLQSYESAKTNQIKQLTENITNLYKDGGNVNPSTDYSSNGTKNSHSNFVQFNQPNINIQNTYYNMGLNGMNMNMMNGINNMNGMNQYNMNVGMGLKMNTQPQITPTIPNQTLTEQPFNYDYFNTMKQTKLNPYSYNTTLQNASMSSPNMHINSAFYDLGGGSTYQPYQQPTSSPTKKKEEDPFKNLVSFK